MATSPDYLRQTADLPLALADSVLDSLRDAVVVIDTRHRHFPVVLANATARRRLAGQADSLELVESSLHRWLAAPSASALEAALAAVPEGPLPTGRVLAWRLVDGEIAVMTDIKPLDSAPWQRLVMLTFAVGGPEPGQGATTLNPSFDLLILDGELKVTYANAGAEHSNASVPGGLLSASAP